MWITNYFNNVEHIEYNEYKFINIQLLFVLIQSQSKFKLDRYYIIEEDICNYKSIINKSNMNFLTNFEIIDFPFGLWQFSKFI